MIEEQTSRRIAARTQRCRRAGILVIVGMVATPGIAVAQTTPSPTVEQLADLVRRQSEEIASLRQRLDMLEGRKGDQSVSGDAAPAASAPAQYVAAAPASIVPPGPAEQSLAAARGEQAQASAVVAVWDAGLPTFHSADGVFTFKPRGRVLTDFTGTTGSRYGDRNLTTTGMRALRLGFEGGVGPHLFYALESDFAGNKVDVGTALVGWRNKLGKLDYDVRVGHLFNDRGFDGGTRSDATPFEERSVVGTAIQPQRGFFGTGGQVRLFGSRWHASIAVTGDATDQDQTHSDSLTVMARAHWNPVVADGRLVHVALWGFDESLASNIDDISRSTVIGGRFNGNLRVVTGPIPGATHDYGYGVELGGYAGSLWAMGEAGRRHVTFEEGTRTFDTTAWSVSTGYFLTGEVPPYNARTGNFAQPHVRHPVFEGGTGAVELTARYESLDYTDVLLGGRGWAATIGVNWYLNNFTRIMLNGIRWYTDNKTGQYTGPDDGDTIAMRVGVTF